MAKRHDDIAAQLSGILVPQADNDTGGPADVPQTIFNTPFFQIRQIEGGTVRLIWEFGNAEIDLPRGAVLDERTGTVTKQIHIHGCSPVIIEVIGGIPGFDPKLAYACVGRIQIYEVNRKRSQVHIKVRLRDRFMPTGRKVVINTQAPTSRTSGWKAEKTLGPGNLEIINQ